MDRVVGSRRAFVAGVGSLVLGFDPVRRSWVTSAEASHGIKIPHLDGRLLTDAATLNAFGDDFGHLVHELPIAVLEPGSVEDVVRAVKFCRQHDIPVAMRGQGHSTFGQAQAGAGLVVDSSSLDAIEEVGPGHATVQAGIIWRNFLKQVEPTGQRPPVITGYTGLSVGGTISMGGIGPASFRHGAIVHNVIELEVVTGEGVLRTCSPSHNSALFAAAVGGVGQFGVIVRAKIALVPVAARARNYVITYFDFPTFFADMNALAAADRVDGIYSLFGAPAPTPSGFVFLLNVVKYFDPGAPPDDGALLAGLHFDPGTQLGTTDMSALEYDVLVDAQLDALPFGPHVWGDVFLPASQTAAFVEADLARITPADLAPPGFVGFVLLFPVKNRSSRAPAFRLPTEPLVFLYDVLTAGDPGDPAYAGRQLPKARARFEAARAVGGTLYPIGSTPMTRQDWIQQYGPLFPFLKAAKKAFDPRGILTPGPGIF
ncbi:MAG TPA: FAD-binding protein [Polyangia bacterium]|nr:FAD-binding protein [Polyangia bacterium]